jgi:hypothetical protein
MIMDGPRVLARKATNIPLLLYLLNIRTTYSGDYWFYISATSPAMLSEALLFFSVAPHKHQDSTLIQPQPFPSTSFPIHHLSIILPLDTTWSMSPTASENKPEKKQQQ